MRKFSQSSATENVLYNWLTDETQHPLSNEDNLNQVNDEIQDESDDGFIPRSDNNYVPCKLSSEFRFMDGCDFAACTKIILYSL